MGVISATTPRLKTATGDQLRGDRRCSIQHPTACAKRKRPSRCTVVNVSVYGSPTYFAIHNPNP